MEIHFTPEKEARLQQLAARSGRDPSQIVEEAVDRFLDEDVRFRAAVQKGLASLDRGDFIDEEEMNARLERMLNS